MNFYVDEALELTGETYSSAGYMATFVLDPAVTPTFTPVFPLLSSIID